MLFGNFSLGFFLIWYRNKLILTSMLIIFMQKSVAIFNFETVSVLYRA